MCGIVGYLGRRAVVPLMMDSLKQLEYRGYDSAGVAYLDSVDPEQPAIHVYKASGKLLNLTQRLPETLLSENGHSNGHVNLGIGHIRWATHGAATDQNAHPHLSESGDLALVHNGIIENFQTLRSQLQAQGIVFRSETDTECVVHLLAQELTASPDDLLAAIQRTVSQLKGAYALTILSRRHADRVYAVRHNAPLVIGLCGAVSNNGKGLLADEYLVASDAVALAANAQKLVYLHNGVIAEVSQAAGVRIFSLTGEPVSPVVESMSLGTLQVDRKGYKHFMLKEIHEQPDVVRASLSGRLLGPDQPIQLTSRTEDASWGEALASINRIMILGCGSSYNAGLVGKYLIEEAVRLPVEVEAAGECRYRTPIIDERTLVVAISQSGETADTLEALRQAKARGAKTMAVTNREEATLARESDWVLPVRAGVEVSVCATKSFLAQVLVLVLLGLSLAEQRQTLPVEALSDLKHELLKLPALIEAALADDSDAVAAAKRYAFARDVLFIARGVNFPVALEGALKLKEISYIHAEGYSGSELKHGPIAMLDANVPVVSVLVPGAVFDKMVSNAQEAKARDARLIAVTTPDHVEALGDTFETVLTVPRTHEWLSPMLTTVPLQLLAYHMADYLGKDVDQPRNLAKSVTVE